VTLADLFVRLARDTPERTALVVDGEARSFGQLERGSRAVWAALARHGVARGDRVGVLAHSSVPLFEVLGACALGGLVAMPLSWRLGPRELEPLLLDAEPAALLVDSAHAPLLAELRSPPASLRLVGCLDGAPPGGPGREWLDRPAPEPPAVDVAPADIAHMLYTSGTTGIPKAACLSHAAQLASARALARDFDIRPGDVLVTALPMFHIGGIALWLEHLVAGASAVVLSRYHSGRVLDALERHRGTFLGGGGGPAGLAEIARLTLEARPALPALRRVFYSGSALSPALHEQLVAAFGPRLLGTYGMTENCSAITRLPPEEHTAARLASCGRPASHVEIRLLDDDGRDVAAGRVGEVAVRSPSLFAGYWRRPAETAAAMHEGWLRTGDLGERDVDGYLRVVDRKKDMIKTGGESVFSREVERVLERHEAVAEAAVFGVPHPRWGEAVHAAVVLHPGRAASAEELIAHCRQHLASYKKPLGVDFLAALPRNHLGKILKADLRARFGPGR
jgi:acyl-CoA synthetase (AMP-forming)/AMP-acid ligase II